MKKRLSDLASGETGIIDTIHGPVHDLMCLGLRAGKAVKMVTKQPAKGPVVVLSGEVEIAMGVGTAKRVDVIVTPPEA
jgi:ferrous iron transport protein A